MALLTNLVSFWKLEEASGNRADALGTNALTPNGTPGNTTGRVGNAVQLVSASSQYLSITDGSQTGLDPLAGDFALSAWIYPDTLTAQFIICKCATAPGSAAPGYNITLTAAGGIQVQFADGSTTAITSASAGSLITASAWNHVAVNFNRAGNVETFINNVSRKTTSISAQSASMNMTNSFLIGARNNIASFFNGRIDAVGYWSRALTTQEISDLYNGGNGVEHPFGGILVAAGMNGGMFDYMNGGMNA